MEKSKNRAVVLFFGLLLAICLMIGTAAVPASAESVSTEENPTQITWAKMSSGEATYDGASGTITFASEAFQVTPMMYSSRGEGAYADSPYADYNDSEFRFDFQVNPHGSYDEYEIDDPEAGEWYLTFSFRNPDVGAAGQEWEATYATFFILRENATVIRISSGSTARADALELKIPRRVKGTDGKWTTEDPSCVDFLDNQQHSVEISILEDDRRIVLKIDGETLIDCDLDTYEDGKYSAFEIEPVGGYLFQAMNCDATVSDIKIWGNDIEKNIVTPTGVELNKTTLEMNVGDTEYLRAKMVPSDAESKIIWKSSDPETATVNETGMVTALKPTDEVKIIATIQGYEDEIEAVCTVKINGEVKNNDGGCGGSISAAVSAVGISVVAAGAAVIALKRKSGRQE